MKEGSISPRWLDQRWSKLTQEVQQLHLERSGAQRASGRWNGRPARSLNSRARHCINHPTSASCTNLSSQLTAVLAAPFGIAVRCDVQLKQHFVVVICNLSIRDFFATKGFLAIATSSYGCGHCRLSRRRWIEARRSYRQRPSIS